MRYSVSLLKVVELPRNASNDDRKSQSTFLIGKEELVQTGPMPYRTRQDRQGKRVREE